MSEPLAGNYKHLYDIEVQFEVVTGTLVQANIPIEGLFLNADAGFDSKNFRESYEKKKSMRTSASKNVTGTMTGMDVFTKNFINKNMPSREQTLG